MIIGVGTDLVSVERINKLLHRWGQRALQRMFTPFEILKKPSSAHSARHYAKRFAAKEALVKALGTGFTQNVSFQDIEVANDSKGKPFLLLKGKAAEILLEMTKPGYKPYIHLTLSDTQDHALAFVVIEQLSMSYD